MSTPSGMSCESCRDLLIELVCDELSAEMAAEVRAHALKCERCGPELAKLSATLRVSRDLPLLTPSPEVAQRIMQAARDAMPGRARGPAREASTPAASGLTAWFAKLGSFAMSPQVAMASVLLLVVGIGLYALPLGQAPEHAALRATEDESEGASAPPSPASPAASATSAPIVEADKRSGEARESEPPAPALNRADKRGGTGAAERATGFESKKQGADLGESAYGSSKPKLGRATRSVGSLSDDFGAESEARKEPVAKSAPSTKSARQPEPWQEASKAEAPVQKELRAKAANDAPVTVDSTADPLASSQRFAPAPPAAAAAPRPQKTSAPSGASAPKDAEFARAPAEEVASKGSAAKSASLSPLAQGIAAARRGDHKLAESLLTPIASGGAGSERSEATLWLARSLRERGDCARALTYYRVLTQAVTAPRAVLEEAADCHQRTGNQEVASRLRARAALPTKQ